VGVRSRKFSGVGGAMLVRIYKTEPGFETKSQIYAATKELLKTSNYDKTTVKEICEAVGISRTKFYRNFYDKYAIILWLIDLHDSLGTSRIGRNMSLFEGFYITNVAIFEEPVV
jgi:AcrR family transcriptional regulator